mmetsp:Transcript_35297/g.43575  ORF Transcript_35297/g.43575 Transcript_35297/m.43575 type:complete len:327 (-) Transcript_35297:673-1653(-)|eukprot:CAMPEP_0204839594 /NCGR_PEP_ID=MMETSP1346-20131115/34802_1 /ASSEMBLY_ACC=CAM_ASM_000771 /TAXON_ID=215587 /ORGANISM="Aplanochytrium stocchinoi, Strain GSBS06" /LENGTH=326 /DNA_ID=CAMNT_0051976449 /DNA_START=107 /DNA_END=1087 /DNA_ORIENTATION=+
MSRLLGVSELRLGLALCGVLFSAGTGWWYGRKFVFCFRLSSRLRQAKPLGLKNLLDCDEGDYVYIVGTAKPRRKPLKTPMANKDCLYYSLTKRHIYENIQTKTTKGGVTVGSMFRVILSFLSRKPTTGTSSLVASHQITKGIRNVEEDILTTEKDCTDWVIADSSDDGDSNVFVKVDLDGFFEYASHLKDLRVADLKDYLSLTRIFERFEETKGARGGSNKIFRTIGYTVVEEALLENDHVIVFGEISKIVKEDNENATIVCIGSAINQNLLDLKTARVRPFVISTKSQSALMRSVETDALNTGFKAAFFSIAGFAFSVYVVASAR